MVNILSFTLAAGQTSITINRTANTQISSILVIDAVSHECVLPDIVINASTIVISIAEAYNNNLNIIIMEV